jgi:hypothetical protein
VIKYKKNIWAGYVAFMVEERRDVCGVCGFGDAKGKKELTGKT